MAQKIRIRHTESGITRNGYVGFSFTYLFFGWLVPLIRGEIKIGALHLVFNIFVHRSALYFVAVCLSQATGTTAQRYAIQDKK